MARRICALIYTNGSIENTNDGERFVCPRPRGLMFDRNINLATLELLIKESLRFPHNEAVSQIIYRAPISLSPLKYGSLYLEDDSSVQVMMNIYSQFGKQLTCIELYVYTVSLQTGLSGINDHAHNSQEEKSDFEHDSELVDQNSSVFVPCEPVSQYPRSQIPFFQQIDVDAGRDPGLEYDPAYDFDEDLHHFNTFPDKASFHEAVKMNSERLHVHV